ncbi:MAG: GTP cyclohydrolase I FolE [candidate division WOR-3 bacterium]|nr:GTP cyclohydrolase I FolE [candidate division WOR-3 bacterium]
MEKIDKEKIKRGMEMILEGLDIDLDSPNFRDTPQRVADMYSEIFSGLMRDVKKDIKLYETKNQDEMIILRDIPFYSMCEHHLLPFYGVVHIAYIPKENKITGFSNLIEVVDTMSKRPQIQERLTTDIADTLVKLLNPRGIFVIVEAEQLCLYMRGIKKPGTYTITSAIRGIMKNDITREEALNLIGAGRKNI